MPDNKIKTPAELKARYAAVTPDGKFFDSETLYFFGSSKAKVQTATIGGTTVVVYSEWQRKAGWYAASVFNIDGSWADITAHGDSRFEAIQGAVSTWATDLDVPSSEWSGQRFAVERLVSDTRSYDVVDWTPSTITIRQRSWDHDGPSRTENPGAAFPVVWRSTRSNLDAQWQVLRKRKDGTYRRYDWANPLRFDSEPPMDRTDYSA